MNTFSITHSTILVVIVTAFYVNSCANVSEPLLVWAHSEEPHKILDEQIALIKVRADAQEILFWAAEEAAKRKAIRGPLITMESNGYDHENGKKILIHMRQATLGDVFDVVCEKMNWTYYVAPHAIIVRCDMSVDPAWKNKKTWATDRKG